MGYGILTTPEKAHRETSSSSQKSASGEFFEKPVISHQEKRSQPLNLLLENRSCSTKNASALNIPVLWNGRRYDEQTDLYYYNYRHYKADIGRLLGRDPIEENGGINLYGFTGNRPLDLWDKLGLNYEPKLMTPVAKKTYWYGDSQELPETRKFYRVFIGWDADDSFAYIGGKAYYSRRYSQDPYTPLFQDGKAIETKLINISCDTNGKIQTDKGMEVKDFSSSLDSGVQINLLLKTIKISEDGSSLTLQMMGSIYYKQTIPMLMQQQAHSLFLPIYLQVILMIKIINGHVLNVLNLQELLIPHPKPHN